jgi:hypothetical protein
MNGMKSTSFARVTDWYWQEMITAAIVIDGE